MTEPETRTFDTQEQIAIALTRKFGDHFGNGMAEALREVAGQTVSVKEATEAIDRALAAYIANAHLPARTFDLKDMGAMYDLCVIDSPSRGLL